MNEPTEVSPEQILAAAFGMAATMKISGKTAVRRLVGTAEWRDDQARVEAAEAKRQRRQQRNLRNAQ